MSNPRGNVMDGLKRKVFSFRIASENPAYPTFGCVARSVAEAHQKAQSAGWPLVALTDAREMLDSEHDEFGQRYIAQSPLLGPQWMPFAQALRVMAARVDYDKTMGVQVLSERNGHEENGSPFAQLLFRRDGSVQAEIGSGRSLKSSSYTQRELDVLAALFWSDPGVIGPLVTKTYLPGYSWYTIALEILLALTQAFGVTDRDHFTFYNQSDGCITEERLLLQVGDGVFALPA